jgi:hypothetical protein
MPRKLEPTEPEREDQDDLLGQEIPEPTPQIRIEEPGTSTADLGPVDLSGYPGDLLGPGGQPPSAGGRKGGAPRELARVQDHIYELPIEVIEAVYPWLYAPQPGREELRQRPFEEAVTAYLRDLVLRDMYADRERPPDEKQYDFSEWLGASFADLLDRWLEKRHEETMRAWRDLIRDKIQRVLPNLDPDLVEAIVS